MDLGIGLGLTMQRRLLGNPFLSLMSTLLSGASQLIAHPLDYGSMFQDRAGTTPVTAPGQLVGLVLDHGLTGKAPVLGPELVTNGDFSDGTAGWTFVGAELVNGVARIIGSQSIRQENFDFAAGVFYEIRFDVTRHDAGALNINLQLGSGLSVVTTLNPPQLGINKILVRSTGNSRLSFSGNSVADLDVDNISVRELPGYHATAVSDAARGFFAVVPETGRRNLLTHTEAFDNAAWAKLGPATVTANATIAPNGTATAGRFNFGAALDQQSRLNQSLPATASGLTIQSYFRGKADVGTNTLIVIYSNGPSFARIIYNLAAGTSTFSDGALSVTHSIQPDGQGFFRCSATFTSAADAPRISIRNSGPSASGDGIFIWGAQLELGSTATAYQRVGTQFDVTEAGVRSLSYLAYNGVNTAYQTPVLPAPGVDKAQVFAGVRKLSDASIGCLMNMNNTSLGALRVLEPHSTSLFTRSFLMRGSNLVQSTGGAAFAPVSSVISGLADTEVAAILRINGVQITQTLDSGGGNFLSSPISYGSMENNTLFLNGHHYGTLGPITRFGTNATAEQIAAAEAYYTARVI